MQCLLDSDVIWKLATFNLLSELLEVLGAKKSQLYCLRELKYQLRSTKFMAMQSRDATQRVTDFIKGTKEIAAVDPAEQIILNDARSTYQNRVERIDVGEQLLFMGTKYLPQSVIFTHDKKSLRTLATDASCKAIYERVKGHVVCLEQIILKMFDQYGYEPIHRKVAPQCSVDEVMLESFANGKSVKDHPELECRKWLHDYIDRINAATTTILADNWVA